MDHDLELISPILEILEIEVSNILYNPGNIGNLSFSNFSYPGNIGHLNFLISHIVDILENRFFSVFSYPKNAANPTVREGAWNSM